jgi:pimeloyl-ACP methyl ester carboxylesterase
VLLGHSLGGHIVSRFAALFPDLVRATVIVEGLGPPDARHAGDPSTRLKMEGQRLIDTLSAPARQRPLPNVAFAAERLLANNPRLEPDRALELAHQGTTSNDSGELNWAFDPRVGAVFLGGGDSVEYWAHVRCPTCIVAGAHSAEYWGRAIPASAEWKGAFAPGELEARTATFPDAELVMLEGSGHMVHFDEPDRLAEVTLDFLRRRL